MRTGFGYLHFVFFYDTDSESERQDENEETTALKLVGARLKPGPLI